MTKYIQPLDVCINRPFKSALHYWGVDIRIKNQNSRKPNAMEIIDAKVKIWNNDEIITPCNIINSFKITQISINLNGSEQHLLKKTDEINEEIILPNDVI